MTTRLRAGDLCFWTNPWVNDGLFMLVLQSELKGSDEEITAWYFDGQDLRIFCLPKKEQVDRFCTILSRVDV